MTTAHRPTWKAAKGGEEQGGMRIFAPSQQRSVKDLPLNASLKFRDLGQSSATELRKRDLKAELLAKERKHFAEKLGAGGQGAGARAFDAARESDLRLLERTVPGGGGGGGGSQALGGGDPGGERASPSRGAEAGSSPGSSARGASSAAAAAERYASRDADVRVDDSDEASSSDDDDEGRAGGFGSDASDSSDDEEAALMAELARLRAERKAEAARREEAERKAEREKAREEALVGNPLLSDALADQKDSDADGARASKALKRRWDDDVVFRNQDRTKRQETRRFINDTIRNDFHKRFLDRYMR